jgi:hypothetical protein
MLNFGNQFPFRILFRILLVIVVNCNLSFVCSFCPSIFSYADFLAFLFSVDKSIGSGRFFPDLDPSVNLIDYAADQITIYNDYRKWRLCVGPNDRQTFLLLGAVKN